MKHFVNRVYALPDGVSFIKWAEATGKRISDRMYNSSVKAEICESYAVIVHSRHSDRVGVAYCNYHIDTFNRYIGLTIAYYRFMGWELPSQKVRKELHLTQLRVGYNVFIRNNYKETELCELIGISSHYLVFHSKRHNEPIIHYIKDGEVYTVIFEKKWE